jgi:hypothetical protein
MLAMPIDWGSVPDWIVVGTAIAGTAYAGIQLKALKLSDQRAAASHAEQVQIARANLLLEIDATFEGTELYRSRKAIRALRNRAETKVTRGLVRNQTPDALKNEISIEFSHQLDELWKIARTIDEVDVEKPDSKDRIAADRYTELMAVPNWIETIGMLCRRNLLPKEDILDLYDQVVVPTIRNFKNHFEVRRAQGPYLNPRFMENAYWLLAEAEAYKRKREEPVSAPPVESPTKWT